MDSMRDESCRLASYYQRWPPNSPVQPRDLAAAGLYYTGSEDKVQCAFCGGVLREWEIGDIPMVEHQRHFPYCGFVQGFLVGSSRTDGGRQSQSHVEGIRVGSTHSAKRECGSRMSSFETLPKVKERITGDLAKAGFSCTATNVQQSWFTPSIPSTNNGQAVYPQYEEIDKRLKSFRDTHMTAVNPRHLSAAGYFYDPLENAIRSFCCGKALAPRNWNGQNLFAVHEEGSPSCHYVRNPSHLFQAFGLIPGNDMTRQQIQELFRQVTEPPVPEVQTRSLKDELEPECPIQDTGLTWNLCKICHNDPPCVVFLPCGHLICCADCSPLCNKCCVCCSSIWARLNVLFG